MPLYVYECNDCGETQEQVFKIADKPETVRCDCGGLARKVMSIGMVVGDDMPPWMRAPELLGCLQNSAERPVNTRSEYNALIKKRNIIETSKYSEF